MHTYIQYVYIQWKILEIASFSSSYSVTKKNLDCIQKCASSFAARMNIELLQHSTSLTTT